MQLKSSVHDVDHADAGADEEDDDSAPNTGS